MIWVNGKPAEYINSDTELTLFSQTLFGARNAGCTGVPSTPPLPNWDKHSGGIANTFRFGECSDHGFGPYARHYAADSTIDEPSLWKINEGFYENPSQIEAEVPPLRREAIKAWDNGGRYYRPNGDANFTSAPIFFAQHERSFSPGSSGVASGVGASGGGMTAGGGTVSAGASSKKIRLMGFSYTVYEAGYSKKDGKPLAFDWSRPSGGAYALSTSNNSKAKTDCGPVKGTMSYSDETEKVGPIVLKQDGPTCVVVLRVTNGGNSVKKELAGKDGMGYANDGFSQTYDAVSGASYTEFDQGDALEYEVRFRIVGLQAGSILLDTPFFDDITFYYTHGETEYLSWRLVNTAT